jgi:imidazolonepropionase-like amidohydrolase
MLKRPTQRSSLIIALILLFLPVGESSRLSGQSQPGDQQHDPILIENVLIKTVTQGEFTGSVLIQNGTITAVGPNVAVPPGARRIDGTGKILTPGLVDSHSHLGLGPSGGTTEDNEGSNPSTPELRIIDSIHPEGVAPHRFSFTDAVREGVTTVIARPGSGNVIGGMSAALKLRGGTVDEMVLRFPLDMKMAMGKKGGYASKGQFPMTKMGTAFVVRKAMIEAGEYKESLARFEADTSKTQNAVRPKRNLGHEAMMLVLEKDIPVHIHASPVDDIMTAVRLHDEFDFSKLSIGHGDESYKVADILAEKGVMVVVGPQMITFDDDGRLINIAGFLVDHGVEVNIMTDADVVQQEFLRFQAAIAVKYGMDPLEALKAITINPARWAGLEDRIGSIEEGKDADLVLFDGDPFDVFTKVQMVFIDGELVFDASASEGEEGS